LPMSGATVIGWLSRYMAGDRAIMLHLLVALTVSAVFPAPGQPTDPSDHSATGPATLREIQTDPGLSR